MKNKAFTEDINKALLTLHNGGSILYPTDTIWGIGCDATNEKAVQKLYEIKKRTDAKSMLVLVNNFGAIKHYVEAIPADITKMVEQENKPLTIIYPGAKNLAANLIASDGSIGIRIVKDEFCIRLISEFGKPIVSTSANISGNPSPHNFNDIEEEILKNIDYVVKWRQDENSSSKPSAIIKVGTDGKIEVLRK